MLQTTAAQPQAGDSIGLKKKTICTYKIVTCHIASATTNNL